MSYHLKMEWKNIEKTNYSVSNLGFVKNNLTNKILKNSKDKNGYAVVNIYFLNRQQKKYVHRLVADAFLENKENKPQVAHIDGNGMNASVENLRWSTQSENEKDKIVHGRYNKNPYGMQIFNREKLDKIFELCKTETSIRKIAKIMNTSHGTILNIINKKTYKNLGNL